MANRKIRAELDIDGKDNTSPAFRSVAKNIGNVEKQIAQFNKQAAAFNRTSSEFSRRIADIDRASAAMSHRHVAVAKATEGVANASDRIALAAARFVAPAALGAAVGYAAKEALLDFAALDREMTRIGNTAGASAEETKAAFATMQTESKQLAMPLSEAVTAIDTLVSSGLTLKEAMDFLPSVLATTQASGAEVTDIANTGLKTASAFKLQAGDMQHAFDLMVASGQSGQFELKDMARYIPSLANAFARIGYRGEDGLKRLMAALQTVREDTGTAEEAADDVANVFQKMASNETISNFKKFGINLAEEMDKAKQKGEDTLDAFVRLSNQAVKGDLTKLPQLFTDKQVLDGMTSLITSTDRLTHYYSVLNETSIDGTVARNNLRLLNDTQASVDRLSNSYEKLKTSAGAAVAKAAVPVMDGLSKSIDYNSAVQNDSEKAGHGFWSWDQWKAPFREYAAAAGIPSARRSQDQRAYQGGYRDPEWLKTYWSENAVEASGPMLAADRSHSPELTLNRGRGLDRQYSLYHAGQQAMREAQSRQPIPERNSDLQQTLDNLQKSEKSGQSTWRTPGEGTPGAANALASFFRVPSKDEWHDALKIDLKPSADEASQSIADGGKKAGDSISESAAKLSAAGAEIGASILSAFASVTKGLRAAPSAPVNADLGRSMPPSVTNGGDGGF